MTALVTGGTGFIGAHVVRALLAAGRRVRCLIRPSSDLRNLDGLDVEYATGDLTDAESVRSADVRLRRRLPRRGRLPPVRARSGRAVPQQRRRHAQRPDRRRGRARAARGLHQLRRHAGAVARRRARRRDARPPARRWTTWWATTSAASSWPSARSIAACARGLPVVVVNPSTPVGDGDIKPTPTGQIIVDFLNGRMPAYVDTGLNLVDVRDVAAGHLLAADAGRPGERYILAQPEPDAEAGAGARWRGSAGGTRRACACRTGCRWRSPTSRRRSRAGSGGCRASRSTACACHASGCSSTAARRCASSACRRARSTRRCGGRSSGSRSAATSEQRRRTSSAKPGIQRS